MKTQHIDTVHETLSSELLRKMDAYWRARGKDMPEILNWKWNQYE